MDGFFLSNWVYLGLKWLHETVMGGMGGGSFFWTIVVFTVVLKLLTMPADIKQRKSSAKMAALSPELEKLKKKYSSDPRKMQEMQSALYKKNGVSMFSSCLPMLLTMPLFIAFLGAMRVWANESMIKMLLEINAGNTAVFESFRWLWVHNIFQPDSGLAPVLMDATQFQQLVDTITKDLNNLVANPAAQTLFPKEVMEQFLTLAPNYEQIIQPVMDTFVSGVNAEGAVTYYMNGYFILAVLAGGSSFLSSWVQRKLQPQMQQQQGMGKGMNLMMVGISVFFCATSNAAFAIYWIVSNVCGLALQLIMFKAFNKDQSLTKQLAEGGAK